VIPACVGRQHADGGLVQEVRVIQRHQGEDEEGHVKEREADGTPRDR
jgi:hypothetical protein